MQHQTQQRGCQHQSRHMDQPSPFSSKRRRRLCRDRNSYQKSPSLIATEDSIVPKCTRHHKRRFMAPSQDSRSTKTVRVQFFDSIWDLLIQRQNNNLAL